MTRDNRAPKAAASYHTSYHRAQEYREIQMVRQLARQQTADAGERQPGTERPGHSSL